MIAIWRRRRSLVALAVAFYFTSVATVLYLSAAQVGDGPFAAALSAAAAAHVLMGWLIGWPSLALPLISALTALPAAFGVGMYGGDDWLWIVLVAAPAAVVLTVLGVGGRTWLSRLRAGERAWIRISRGQSLALAFYVAAVAALVFAAPVRPPVWAAILVVVCAAAAHLVAGYAIGWWSLALPGIIVVLAVPADALNIDPDQEIPEWFVALVWAAPALALLLVGACVRAYARRRRQPPRGVQTPPRSGQGFTSPARRAA